MPIYNVDFRTNFQLCVVTVVDHPQMPCSVTFAKKNLNISSNILTLPFPSLRLHINTCIMSRMLDIFNYFKRKKKLV